MLPSQTPLLGPQPAFKYPYWVNSMLLAVGAFGVYFCMYAFRKPFTAASFEQSSFLHISYKVWLVVAQVIGYTLSKFLGIRIISTVQHAQRAKTIIGCIIISWLALLLFAMVPAPWGIACLLLNGIPLGMVWGLVFSYLEGRTNTELLGAILCTSFIFSSGVVKSIGKWFMLSQNVSENWMPFVTGALFILPTFLLVYILNQCAPPTAADINSRRLRQPMTAEDRKQFIRLLLPGIVMLVMVYMLLTILRDFRDNFSAEIFNDIGLGNNAAIFTQSEGLVSIFVLVGMGALIFIKRNKQAFILNHTMIIAGFAISFLATALFMHRPYHPAWWMVCVGIGLYMSYIPFNAIYFERMIAVFNLKGNVGFIMYISDAFGYLGAVLVLFVKEFGGKQIAWASFFQQMILCISIVGIIGTIITLWYFLHKIKTTQK